MNFFNSQNNKSSLLALILILLVYLVSFHFYSPWKNGIVGGGDTWGYYLYLPAIFIHGDLDNLETSLKVRDSYHKGMIHKGNEDNPLGVWETHLSEKGKQVNKYTLGLSMLYLPFFLLAHGLAAVLGLPADGYSFIYIYIMCLSSIVFVMLGFWFLRKVLLRHFSDLITGITLLIIAFGTNLYYFSVSNAPMAHAYLFFLYAILIYLTQNWYQNKRFKSAAGIGLTAGLITLIRPSEIICILIPLLWDIRSFGDARDRLVFVFKKYPAYFVSILVFASVAVPQLIYWKYVSGEFLHNSYQDEGFNFSDPALYWGLLQFKNGWLAYTPVMIFALTGILFSFGKRGRSFILPVFVFLPIHIYITYSWWCWNYINGFGSRPMVETYALLSLPLAAFLSFIVSRKWLGTIIYPVLLFFVWLNLFNTYQFYKGLLWSEDANWAYYKAVFGKTSISNSDLATYDSGEEQPDEQSISFEKVVYKNSFEDSSSTHYFRENAFEGEFSFMVDKALKFSPGYNGLSKDIDAKAGDWLKASVDCMRRYSGNSIYSMSSLVVEIGDGKKWRHIRLDNKPGNTENSLWGGKPNVWGNAWFFVRLPQDLTESDIIKIYVWNATDKPIYIDNLKLEVWKSE